MATGLLRKERRERDIKPTVKPVASEKCRSHRGRRDWVAPVSDERSRLFGTVAESREAASSHPGGVEGRSEGVQTAATSGSGSADTEGRESGDNRDHERPGRPCTANH